jgi:hypothetical protein
MRVEEMREEDEKRDSSWADDSRSLIGFTVTAEAGPRGGGEEPRKGKKLPILLIPPRLRALS